jgi:hypothetical protein
MVGELVGRNEKRPERGVFIETLAETKGDSVVEEKPVDSNGYKGFRGVHVVKTCGEMLKVRHNFI